jgi:hypothetical protein
MEIFHAVFALAAPCGAAVKIGDEFAVFSFDSRVGRDGKVGAGCSALTLGWITGLPANNHNFIHACFPFFYPLK